MSVFIESIKKYGLKTPKYDGTPKSSYTSELAQHNFQVIARSLNDLIEKEGVQFPNQAYNELSDFLHMYSPLLWKKMGMWNAIRNNPYLEKHNIKKIDINTAIYKYFKGTKNQKIALKGLSVKINNVLYYKNDEELKRFILNNFEEVGEAVKYFKYRG